MVLAALLEEAEVAAKTLLFGGFSPVRQPVQIMHDADW